MLSFRTVPHLFEALHPGPRQMAAVAFGAAATIGLVCYAVFRPRPDPDEIERQRRLALAERGRITDATLIDSPLPANSRGGSTILEAGRMVEVPPEIAPHVLHYQYRVAGVTYESAQDVSQLPDRVRNVRIDLPVQVRYDPLNPGNSIVVAESWSGLRLDPHRQD
jgi:hypothetical protein